MKLTDIAKKQAEQAHKGQTDLAGEDYMHHVETVVHLVKQLTDDEETIVVAWLHDTIEDTDDTLDDDAYSIYPESVRDGISQMTRPKHYPYKNYIKEMTSQKAKIVKIADLLHNQDDNRLPLEKRNAKRKQKYHDALLHLVDHNVEQYSQLLLMYKQEYSKIRRKG